MANELKQALDQGLRPSPDLAKDIRDAIIQKMSTKGADAAKFEIELPNKYGYDATTLRIRTFQVLKDIKEELIKLDPKATEYRAYTILYEIPKVTHESVRCAINYGEIQLVDYSD